MISGEHYNYILYNTLNNTTYNGYTINLARRLRQHNGELSGGAKSTKKYCGHWRYLAIITSPQFTKQSALSFEWHIRYPTGRKPRPNEFTGPQGRLSGLERVLALDKFKDFEFEVSFEKAE
jgi:predicted GIY-YIG superfamily endonuclease